MIYRPDGREDWPAPHYDPEISEFQRGYAAGSAGLVLLMGFMFIMGMVVMRSMFFYVGRICLTAASCP